MLPESEVGEYIRSVSECLADDFSTTTGLPEPVIPEDAHQLPGLVIVTDFSATGYSFRTGERNEEYQTRTQRNQQLARQGRFDELDTFDWTDPEYTLDELESLLIRSKNQVYDAADKRTCYVQIFVEIYTPKEKILEFLALLKRLQIMYQETY